MCARRDDGSNVVLREGRYIVMTWLLFCAPSLGPGDKARLTLPSWAPAFQLERWRSVAPSQRWDCLSILRWALFSPTAQTTQPDVSRRLYDECAEYAVPSRVWVRKRCGTRLVRLGMSRELLWVFTLWSLPWS